MRFWLSFATQEAFLGVVVTEADSFRQAVFRCHSLGINPGGEVTGFEVNEPGFDPVPTNRFLSRADLDELGRKYPGLRDAEGWEEADLKEKPMVMQQ